MSISAVAHPFSLFGLSVRQVYAHRGQHRPRPLVGVQLDSYFPHVSKCFITAELLVHFPFRSIVLPYLTLSTLGAKFDARPSTKETLAQRDTCREKVTRCLFLRRTEVMVFFFLLLNKYLHLQRMQVFVFGMNSSVAFPIVSSFWSSCSLRDMAQVLE